MSYDVTIVHPDSDAELFWRNYTSNCAAMWRAAGLDLTNASGATTAGLALQLRSAIAALKADPARYQAMNPNNGWGDYETGLDFLQEVLTACNTHPGAKVTVSC